MLQWRLDVQFREDDRRIRKGNAAEFYSRLCRIALNLLKADKSVKLGIKGKRLTPDGTTTISSSSSHKKHEDAIALRNRTTDRHDNAASGILMSALINRGMGRGSRVLEASAGRVFTVFGNRKGRESSGSQPKPWSST